MLFCFPFPVLLLLRRFYPRHRAILNKGCQPGSGDWFVHTCYFKPCYFDKDPMNLNRSPRPAHLAGLAAVPPQVIARLTGLPLFPPSRPLWLLMSLTASLFLAGCKTEKPLVIGSTNSTEQLVLGEILAQHLEHRLGKKIERRLGINGGNAAYQQLQSGDLSLYPEYSGDIVTNILKEPAAADPNQVLERARGEMRRVAQLELLDVLGFDNPVVMVVRHLSPQSAVIDTLEDAAKIKEGWKIGVSYEFQQRADGVSALTTYKLPMRAAIRGMDSSLLYPSLERGDLTMVSARATDAALTSADWLILKDSRNRFTPERAVVLVRQDLLMKQAGLQAALTELTGKLSVEKMRQLNAQVEIGHRQANEVATEFLQGAGLK